MTAAVAPVQRKLAAAGAGPDVRPAAVADAAAAAAQYARARLAVIYLLFSEGSQARGLPGRAMDSTPVTCSLCFLALGPG